MAFEQIGVEAVIDGLSDFRRGADEFNRAISGMVKTATGAASGVGDVLGGAFGLLGSAIDLVLSPVKFVGEGLLSLGKFALNAVTGGIKFLAEGLGNVLQIALGFIVHDVFNFIIGGISDLAGQALQGAADFQTLEIQMGAFLRGMGETEEEVQIFIDWLSTLAKDSNLTNLAIGDLARGFLSLGEFGVREVQRLITATTLWTAQMGLTESQASRVIDNILQTGRSAKIT